MEIDIETLEALLDTYSLEDILYASELTEYEVLIVLNEQGLLKLPEVIPVG